MWKPNALRGTIYVVAIAVCSVILGVWIAHARSVQAQAEAAAAAPVLRITPESQFSVPANAPIDKNLSIISFAANDTGLYFLLVGKSYAEVVHTDIGGAMINQITLPMSDAAGKVQHGGFEAVRINRNGVVAVLQRLRGGDHIMTFDSHGVGLGDDQLNHDASDVIYADGKLLGWKPASSEVVSEPDGRPVSHGPKFALDAYSDDFPPHLFSLNDETVGVLEHHVPQFHIISLTTGRIVGPTLLVAPEIQGVIRTAPSDDIAPVVAHSPSIATNGHILTAINPYNLDKGGIVLEFDQSGSLVRRYVCALPTYTGLWPNSDANRPRPLTVSFIGISGSRLVLVSQLNKAATYRLPQ